MKYRAVIFDLFGTLVENLRRPEFENMLAEMANVCSVSRTDFVRLWNETWEKRTVGLFSGLEADIEHICRLLNTRPGTTGLSRAAALGRAFARGVLSKPRNEAVTTLTVLKESGFKTGLLSNCAANIPAVWSETPLAPHVDIPIFSCSVGFKKPDPEIYLLASRRLVEEPQKCVYVADGNENELTGASQVGMQPLLFRGPDEDPYDEGRDRKSWSGPTVSSLKEVFSLLDNNE